MRELLLLLVVVEGLLLLLFDGGGAWDTGCGRAKGLGGPEAPAERRADAEGDGGGSTTPEVCGSELPRPFFWALDAAWPLDRGLESPAGLPASDGSSGICTFNTGRLPPGIWAELARDGGLHPSMEEMEMLRFLSWVCARAGGGGELPVVVRVTAPTSTDCARWKAFGSRSPRLGSRECDVAQCCDRMDLDSSIGVKMLRDLVDILFTGSSI